MRVFIAHSSQDRDLVEKLNGVLDDMGHEVCDPMKTAIGSEVHAQVSSAIRSADALIAILRGSSPNSFFELGLASGAGVPALVVTPPDEILLPPDLASVPYVQRVGDAGQDALLIARKFSEFALHSPVHTPQRFDTAEGALEAAARDPVVLESISPMEFEHLIGKLLSERRYKLRPLDAARDVGADFVIDVPEEGGLVLVEAKKLSKQSRVSVEVVRRLHSAVITAGASAGLIVSTSGYTAAAMELAAGVSVVLRTLGDVLAAKSAKELLGPHSAIPQVIAKAVALYRRGETRSRIEAERLVEASASTLEYQWLLGINSDAYGKHEKAMMAKAIAAHPARDERGLAALLVAVSSAPADGGVYAYRILTSIRKLLSEGFRIRASNAPDLSSAFPALDYFIMGTGRDTGSVAQQVKDMLVKVG